MSLDISPLDEHNQNLLDNTHPANWVNPEPAEKYNMVVLGAGTAGLLTAAGTAGLGGKVALIERGMMGGDCLVTGCVPSKALIRAARACAEIRDAAEFGIEVDGYRVNFPFIMERMRRLRAGISPHDSAQRFQGLGVDVFLGEGKFTGPDTVEVDGKSLKFSKAVIATGARAAELPIPGLAEVGYLTNETLFQLTELPDRFTVIGAGPIGCEMAQTFARFGSQVTLIDRAEQILPREDSEAAKIVQEAMQRDGVEFLFHANAERVEQRDGDKVLFVKRNGETLEVKTDCILVAVGRAPNVQGLNLEAAEVQYDDHQGVHVNDKLRTSNKRIFAAGDICSPYKFTHAADAMARIAIRNALFLGGSRVSALTIPWCTYTDPEIAHVGLYEHEAQERNIAYSTFTQEMAKVDRAILDGDTAGFIRVLVRKGTDKILGATVVARHAGELLSEITLAIVGKTGLGTIGSTIHPYPTQAEAIKKLGDAYARTKLTPTVAWLFRKWLAWSR